MGDRVIRIRNACGEATGYSAARVRSLFNCESGAVFETEVSVPDDDGWSIGVIVGPSGSGKTSAGRQIWPGVEPVDLSAGWDADAPIIDSVAPGAAFDDATAAFSAVGLGSVPTWLRPYRALSNGEAFRAGLARVILSRPEKVVIDEFTSVVDRQVARIGAAAFAKSWRRGPGQAVVLTPHYDVIDWMEPDWVFDTGAGRLERGSLWRRPKINLDVYQTGGGYWDIFKPHHYLDLPRMVAPKYYVGAVDGAPVCHIAASPSLHKNGMRLSRMVVMPEWQGAGVGVRFLNAVAALQFGGHNAYAGRVRWVYFHTSHPGLCAGLRRGGVWRPTASITGGANKGKSAASIKKSGPGIAGSGYGGHTRAVNGFKVGRYDGL